MEKKILAGLLSTLVAMVSFVGSAAALVIDEFDGSGRVEVTTSSGGSITGVVQADSVNALGGSRSLYIQQMVPSPMTASIALSVSFLQHSQDVGVIARSVITWDGDKNPNVFKSDGLGGVDLTQDGSTAFLFEYYADHASEIAIEVYDASDAMSGKVSTARKAIAATSGTSSVITVPFADFIATGFSGGADFANVGAIRFIVNTDSVAALDASIDYLRTNGSCQLVPSANSNVIDLCGVCGGDNSSCKDCNGIPNGAAVFDLCNVCGGDNSTCKDCNGVPNGGAVIDVCGVCAGDGTTCLGCDEIPDSGKIFDLCGICGGDSSSCKDCKGLPNGGAKIDLCGVCDGASNTCLDCAGIPNGTAKVDACGECGGTVTDPLLCEKIRNCPSKKLDLCGVCDGNNACLDCAGVPNGTAVIDCCGVCNGDGSSCKDKCKYYDLGATKVKASKAMQALYASVVKYSTQQMKCDKTKTAVVKKRILKAKSILKLNTTAFSTFVANKIKVCDTIYCKKTDLTSVLSTLKKNTKALYNLSRDSQYGAGYACKGPRNTNGQKPSSTAQSIYNSANSSINKIPSAACN